MVVSGIITTHKTVVCMMMMTLQQVHYVVHAKVTVLTYYEISRHQDNTQHIVVIKNSNVLYISRESSGQRFI